MKIIFNVICSLVILTITHSAFAVINGKSASDPIFNAVGNLKVGKNSSVNCTATLVNEKWIVTAKHCVEVEENEESGSVLPASAFEFRLGYDSKKPIFKSKIKRWVYLNSNGDEKIKSVDISFGELVVEVPTGAIKIRPIKMLTQNWNSDDLNSAYTLIGYGVTEAFSSLKSPLTGKRQMAEFKVTGNRGNALLNLFGTMTKLRTHIEKYHTNLNLEEESMESIISNAELLDGYAIHAWDAKGRENLASIKPPKKGWQDTCFGDSGGPLLRNINGQLYVVGVISNGMNRTCETLGTRFSVFGPEIEKLAAFLKL